jgi:hypothetical protein
MLCRLTLPLVTRPRAGWARVAEWADGEVHGEVPSDAPYQLIAQAALVSLAATALGWGLSPTSTTAGTVLHVLAACVAYLGGPVLGLYVTRQVLAVVPASMPACSLRPPTEKAQRAFWFAAGAVVPSALVGALNVVPSIASSFALAMAGAALSARTGWVGANAMLALHGQARFRAAAAPAGTAVGVALLATCIRTVLPS